jgi:hypothetical protein
MKLYNPTLISYVIIDNLQISSLIVLVVAVGDRKLNISRFKDLSCYDINMEFHENVLLFMKFVLTAMKMSILVF